MGLRASIGWHPGPVYIGTGNLLEKKRRVAKPKRQPPLHLTHDGCKLRHVSVNTLTKCAQKKHLPLPTGDLHWHR